MNNYRQGEITPTMLAYMAGFFDAEGCISISRLWQRTDKNPKNRKYYSLCCSASQKYGNVLEIFAEYFGGRVQKAKSTTPCWYVNAGKALEFLQVVEPYLIGKKEEAQVAINFILARVKAKKDFSRSSSYDSQVVFNESQYLLMKKLKVKKLRQLPLMEIHPVEQIYSYLAGFFDGEGCIGIANPKYKNGSSYHRLEIAVSQSDKAYSILELYRYYFGGYILGCNRSSNYYWRVVSRKAKGMLEILLPYLKIKHDQACVALEFQNGMHIKRWKPGLVIEQELAVREAQRIMLHNLKKRGVKK